MSDLVPGLYERLLDEELEQLIQQNSELRAVFRKIDDESAPHLYAQFLTPIIQAVVRSTGQDDRLDLVNRIIELLAATDGSEYFLRKKLLSQDKSLLYSVGEASPPRPETPLSTSLLLTGQNADPPLEHELRAEMYTADAVDILVSFIKWSGLRLLMPALEQLESNGIPVRILSTSYMRASDPNALEWLANRANVRVRISYDTSRTRLHAKAYHFHRNTGFSTAYIGSANMSHSAMTQGLEWTVKATLQDMPHILERFAAEFETYWESREFEPYTQNDFARFREAIREPTTTAPGIQFFAEISARPYQARILEALQAARGAGSRRNLVVAATGTGKTVLSALDYQRFCDARSSKPNLLFVVHRKEILEQALGCFRAVLHDQNFGEILAGGMTLQQDNHVFATVQSLGSRKLWQHVGSDHFDFIIIDEAHHGAAASYRPILDKFSPKILLGLTATPERMDGSSILKDFDERFAAEIRLPEALEEKLLCPFHYFGVSDSIDLSEDSFWRNGRYDMAALESVLTGDDIRAKQRVDTILAALDRYQPDLRGTRAVGFCAGVNHALYMRDVFTQLGYSADTIVGSTHPEERAATLKKFREGKVTFLFAVDVLSEGIDVPEINMVLFLRPTESLTVFLQQLGRGLRHAKDKDCLTVLDFVGQTHRKYRIDQKLSALLSRRRLRIDKEIEKDFPHLPAGCSIQLERVARDTVLTKIKSVLANLNSFVPETIQTWEQEHKIPLNFGNFIAETGLAPTELLKNKTWSEWKALAFKKPNPQDPKLDALRGSLRRIALRSDVDDLATLQLLPGTEDPESRFGKEKATKLHYLLWGKPGRNLGFSSLDQSIAEWKTNESCVSDAVEIAEWRQKNPSWIVQAISLPYPCDLKLHAAYGSPEIKAALGIATLDRPGSTGVGVIHVQELKTYVHLVTFRKDEQDFSPTTRYHDYLITPTLLHWESQSTTSQESPTGQNYIHFKERGYTILFFARVDKRINGETAPFVFLGPAKSLKDKDGDRPITMTWELRYPVPAEMFEEVKAA